jgi:hypothetical protein
MSHFRALHLLMMLAFPLCVGCEQKAASITVEPVPGPILSIDPLPLPSVVVLDEKGQPLEKQPELVFSTLPPGVMQVSNGQLLPLSNGSSLLMVQVKDQELSASVAVEISLLQSIELKCAGNPACAYLPGEEIQLNARMLSAGTALQGVTAAWKSSDEGVVRVLGPGKLRTVAPGTAQVRVEGPNQISATQAVHVVQPTRISVSCIDNPGCTVPAYDSLRLKAEVFGDEHPLPQVAVQWSSSDIEVARVDSAGKVEALKEGSVVMTASGAGLRAEQPLQVGAPTIRRVIVSRADESPAAPQKASALCGDMKIDVHITYQAEGTIPGTPFSSSITGTCSSGGGLDCANQQLNALGKATRDAVKAGLSRINAACCCKLQTP